MPALGAVSSLATSGAVGVASDLTSAPDDRARMLPVHPALAGLFPRGGLRRGSTVAVHGSTSLLFALLAPPTSTGSWAALVGMPDLGLRAAAELGVAVDRVALVRHPGRQVAAVVAALLDGMDVVAVNPARLTESHARRLSARARNRGAVLVATGPWPGADLELTPSAAAWTGLDDGHGYLRARETEITTRGRGAAARPARATVHLPGEGGEIAPPPVHVHRFSTRPAATAWPPAWVSDEPDEVPPRLASVKSSAKSSATAARATAYCPSEAPLDLSPADWRLPEHADVS